MQASELVTPEMIAESMPTGPDVEAHVAAVQEHVKAVAVSAQDSGADAEVNHADGRVRDVVSRPNHRRGQVGERARAARRRLPPREPLVARHRALQRVTAVGPDHAQAGWNANPLPDAAMRPKASSTQRSRGASSASPTASRAGSKSARAPSRKRRVLRVLR